MQCIIIIFQAYVCIEWSNRLEVPCDITTVILCILLKQFDQHQYEYLQRLNIIKHQQLELLDVIGQGSYGAVFQEEWKARKGQAVAVKKYTMPRQVQILSSVPEHPHIITFYGVSMSTTGISIVTEFAEKGSLFNYLHKEKQIPTVDQSLAWALEVAKGMEHLHNHNIIHQDLKSPNIFCQQQ